MRIYIIKKMSKYVGKLNRENEISTFVCHGNTVVQHGEVSFKLQATKIGLCHITVWRQSKNELLGPLPVANNLRYNQYRRHAENECPKILLQIHTGTVPSYFYTYNIKTQGAHPRHDTWQQNLLKTNITNTKYADNTLRNHLPLLGNGTPLYILQKQYYLDMYRIDFSIPNCYVCHQ